MNLGISVIICCYNSKSRIKPTLEHIANQIFNQKILVEVILVDNNSDDGTSKYAQKIWTTLKPNFPLHIIHESTPGLSFARKAGIKKAQNEYILFCDDDNWLAPDYIQIGYNHLKNNNKIGVLGGRGEVVSNIELPHWFSDFQQDYAVGVQNLFGGNITNRGFVWGAGMFLRKSVFESILDLGITSKLSDRKGNALSSGGDTEICQWFVWAGFELWYREELSFKHFMAKERLTKEYYLRLKTAQNQSYEIIQRYFLITNYYESPQSFLKKIIKFVFLSIKKTVFGLSPTDIINIELNKLIPYVFDKTTKELLINYKKISTYFEK